MAGSWGPGRRDTRLAAAAADGFEIRGTGAGRAFDFHAPKYFARFANTTLSLLDDLQLGMFK